MLFPVIGFFPQTAQTFAIRAPRRFIRMKNQQQGKQIEAENQHLIVVTDLPGRPTLS